jgi:hypothetical protein
MKNSEVVLALLIFPMLCFAGTTRVITGTVLNLYSLQKKQLPDYSPPCSLNTDTLHRYDFIYTYFDECVCICPCCPEVRITSPRPFYRSKAPMNYTSFTPSLLAASFTKISGPDSAYGQPCSTLPSVTYGQTGGPNPTPIDSISSRLFVFLSNNGGKLPNYQYMLLRIGIIPHGGSCDTNGPNPGGGKYFPLYDSAQIFIYNGGIVSTNHIETLVYLKIEPREQFFYTLFGKQIQNRRIGGLPAGVYIVDGRLRFLQNNKSIHMAQNTRR